MVAQLMYCLISLGVAAATGNKQDARHAAARRLIALSSMGDFYFPGSSITAFCNFISSSKHRLTIICLTALR
jgi:hypothetical protein